jgi:Protein of unknown function (DUF5672)
MAPITKGIGPSWTISILISIIAVQWILFTFLLQQRHQQSLATIHAETGSPIRNDYGGGIIKNESRYELQSVLENGNLPLTHLSGVAVTIMYRAPKWFFLRYKLMIDNALANLPDPLTWKVQIFINEVFLQDQQLLKWNPGLVRMFHGFDPRVVVTPLPRNLTTRKNKPKDVLLSLWFWENVAAERVLLFSGNGAFCGNQISDAWVRHGLLDLDFVGVPSFEFDGQGGDGSSHSLRNRQAMIRVLQYSNSGGNTAMNNPEHRHAVATMLQMNANNLGPFRVATKEQTNGFGGVYGLSNETTTGLMRLPLVVAGTQDRLTYAERDTLLKHCPELKVIFPSLHEPTCFGARPVAETCQATICALQENRSSHGC